MATAKKPIRRITFDDLPVKLTETREIQSLESGKNRLMAKMSGECVTIEIKLHMPEAKNGKVRQDLLETVRTLREAEKFIEARRKFFDGHVRERLQEGAPVEDGLLTAMLIANRRRDPDWKARSVEMHSQLLRQIEGLSKEDADTKAAVEANRFFEGTEYSEYAPKVSVKVRK